MTELSLAELRQLASLARAEVKRTGQEVQRLRSQACAYLIGRTPDRDKFTLYMMDAAYAERSIPKMEALHVKLKTMAAAEFERQLDAEMRDS